MRHLFVPYSLALLAKENGFNEPCLAEYIVNGAFTIHRQDLNDDGSTVPITDEHINAFTNTVPNYLPQYRPVSAPLYQQLVDWFRDKGVKIVESEDWREDNPAYYVFRIGPSFKRGGPFNIDAALSKAFELITIK